MILEPGKKFPIVEQLSWKGLTNQQLRNNILQQIQGWGVRVDHQAWWALKSETPIIWGNLYNFKLSSALIFFAMVNFYLPMSIARLQVIFSKSPFICLCQMFCCLSEAHLVSSCSGLTVKYMTYFTWQLSQEWDVTFSWHTIDYTCLNESPEAQSRAILDEHIESSFKHRWRGINCWISIPVLWLHQFY